VDHSRKRPANLSVDQPSRFTDEHVRIAWFDEHMIGAGD
jgi:hypothetical protein